MMTETSATAVPGDEVLRVLAWLARTGAAARPSPGGIVVVASAAGDVGTAGAVAWAGLVAHGWVEERTPGLWRLAKAGRDALRRVRSAAGAPAGAEAPTPPSAGADARAEGHASREPGPQVNPRESPLGWLARRRDRQGRPMITSAQFVAGERLRTDLWLAQLTPRVTTNWAALGCGHAPGPGFGGASLEPSDRMLAARERLRQAMAAVGPELSGILVEVCGHLNGLEAVERAHRWPQRSAKVVLQLALDALARHYGMSQPRPRTRHWGAPDYRPQIDALGGPDAD